MNILLIKKYLQFLRSRLHLFKLTNRLQLYLAALVLLLLPSALVLLLLLNIAPSPRDTIKTQLQAELNGYSFQLSTYFSNTAAQGIRLAQLVSERIETTLAANKSTFNDLSNNQDLIEALEEDAYSILRSTLYFADCSGAFAVFDATVNTALPDAEHSRCGIYLRLNNLSTSKPVNPDFTWLRGMHTIGARHGHLFHNKWELEFDLNRIPFYTALKNSARLPLTDCFFYSPKLKLKGTWESMAWLCVPILSSSGKFYGICGLEISSLYFKLTHLSDKSSTLRATGLVACRKDNVLLPATGLESGTASGYFANLGTPLHIESIDNELNRYVSSNGSFVGVEKNIQLSPLDGNTKWSVAYFIPEDDYNFALRIHYIKISIFCIAFFVLGIAITYKLRWYCIAPVLAGINAIKNGQSDQTSFSELDDLINFLRTKQSASETEADMSGFITFKKNIKKLSKAELAVFNLYLKGYSAQEIADVLFISINTVKSHNRRIYMKLEISSRKELLLYAKMLGSTPEGKQS